MEELAKLAQTVESIESKRSDLSDQRLPNIFFHAARTNDSIVELEPALHERAVVKELIQEELLNARVYALPLALILAAVFYWDGWIVGGYVWQFPVFFFATLLGAIAIMMVLAALCQTSLAIGCWFQPNRISLKDTGLEFYGERGKWTLPAKFIYWSQIEKVWIIQSEDGRVGPLKIKLYADGEKPVKDICLPLTAFGPKNLEKLLSGLRRHLRTDKIDASVLQEWKKFHPLVDSNLVLSRVDDPMRPTYTSLWLGVLQNSKARVKTTSLEPGAKLQEGAYEIVSKLGGGGQGTVYLANSTAYGQTETQVALKEFILPAHAGEDAVRRVAMEVEREAALLSRLNHKQIVRLIDSFVEDWRIYLVQEYLEGDSLQNLVEQKGRMGEDDVIKLGLQMCEVLGYLHNQSPPIVHRDFTPHNLMLCKDGTLRLIDFNVAYQSEFNSGKTIVGKRNYIPPEQFRGKASASSDIYALGGTLFFLLTGSDPESLSQSWPKKMREEIREQLDRSIGKATALETAERYSAVNEVAKDLQSLLVGAL